MRFEENTSFLPFSTVWLCLQMAQMPRCQDLAIVVSTDDDRKKTIALPLAHAHEVIIALTTDT